MNPERYGDLSQLICTAISLSGVNWKKNWRCFSGAQTSMFVFRDTENSPQPIAKRYMDGSLQRPPSSHRR